MRDEHRPRELQALFEPAAEHDLEAARAWYFEHAGPRIVHRFDEAFAAVLALLQQYPESAPLMLDERIRARPMGKYPYTIFYTRDETRLVILAVKHQRRSPRSLLRRTSMH